MQNRPDAVELLDAVRELLRDVTQVIRDDGLRFRVLIAANVLGIVERELTAADRPLLAELERLRTLLPEGETDSELVPLRQAIADLTRILAANIRSAPADSALLTVGSPVWEHIKQTLAEQLAVANPAFDTNL